MTEKLAAAIQAAERPKAIRMARLNVTIASTQRPVAIEFPADISESELAEFAGWMLTKLLFQMRVSRHLREQLRTAAA